MRKGACGRCGKNFLLGGDNTPVSNLSRSYRMSTSLNESSEDVAWESDPSEKGASTKQSTLPLSPRGRAKRAGLRNFQITDGSCEFSGKCCHRVLVVNLEYTATQGYGTLGAGLTVGLCCLVSGVATGKATFAGLPQAAQSSRNFVGLCLILVYCEAIGLYGLIAALLSAGSS